MRRRPSTGSPVPQLRQTGAGGAAAAETPGAAAVQVIWGPITESLDLVGMTVTDAHRLLRRPYHIAGGVTALVNGRGASPTDRLRAGDVLEFTRPAGEKGARG